VTYAEVVLVVAVLMAMFIFGHGAGPDAEERANPRSDI
jgi:hypothetical protein